MSDLPIFALEAYLGAREFSTPHMFCSSDMESFSMQDILTMADAECLNLWNNLRLSYTEPKGMPLLRDEIALIYGEQFTRDHILCFSGAEEGIYCAARTLLRPEDHAIAVTPCYQSLESIPASICAITTIELSFEQQWELDIERIKAAIRPNTKLILINYPHNPTGAILSHATQHALVALARTHNLWIFSDEVYRLIERDPADTLPAFATLYDKALSLGVMSKAYGLAGLRIGWIACQNQEMLHQMELYKNYLSICNSAPSEVLALIALRHADTILTRQRNLIKHNFALLESFMERHSDLFDWVKPKGGCIAYIAFKKAINSYDFAEQMRRDIGVLVLPAQVYGQDKPYFRISYGRASMPQMLAMFEDYISL
ncbi:MAG: aminotransferase class I/II-fold pyridoxal phosphate-dependent enzyme [Alphaproteobacteria bacterium]|nr:MAG: aminotransferase class I/II-fold pyridoxal phosphate-dependent enzyme [Alphaproteobacteria bacterium]TAF14988.1 MAG: aminotransferase class I/II-fold pyridoxal phosphate-dependent enzyme [Alphaproteobacteria bacterium]TAF76636.1 MAG: aminotransferase class I/II-fold pyridoxal phosphate-dependent enzyme [Alphaproteobacteria bacterium]